MDQAKLQARRRSSPTFEPIKTRPCGVVASFSGQSDQGDGRGIQMWCQRYSRTTHSGIPASGGASAIQQHLLTTADSKVDRVWLATNECLLQCNY